MCYVCMCARLTGAVHENHEIDKIWIFFSFLCYAYSLRTCFTFIRVHFVVIIASVHLTSLGRILQQTMYVCTGIYAWNSFCICRCCYFITWFCFDHLTYWTPVLLRACFDYIYMPPLLVLEGNSYSVWVIHCRIFFINICLTKRRVLKEFTTKLDF